MPTKLATITSIPPPTAVPSAPYKRNSGTTHPNIPPLPNTRLLSESALQTNPRVRHPPLHPIFAPTINPCLASSPSLETATPHPTARHCLRNYPMVTWHAFARISLSKVSSARMARHALSSTFPTFTSWTWPTELSLTNGSGIHQPSIFIPIPSIR